MTVSEHRGVQLKTGSVLLILLLFTAQFLPAQEKKKKGNFWKILDQVITVDGQPVGSSGLFDKRETIKDSWGTLGAGSSYDVLTNYERTPRNHFYTFEVTSDNAKVRMELNSTNDTHAQIISENGQVIGFVTSGYEYSFEQEFKRAGKYRMIFHALRYSRGTYEMRMSGPFANIMREKTSFWNKTGISFGEEGSGGGRENIYSPRNHRYVFEPQPDSYYDVNVESNGVPIELVVTEPSGKVLFSWEGGGNGVRYIVNKAVQKGPYQIFVSTVKAGERAEYTLEVAGNMIKEPQSVISGFKKVNGKFLVTEEKHDYTFSASEGNIEVLYRSPSAAAEIILKDKFGKLFHPLSYSRPSDRYIGYSYSIPKGDYTVSLTPNQQQEANYEFLIWGNTEALKNTKTQSAVSSEEPARQVAGQNNQIPEKAAQTFLFTGKVLSPTGSLDFRSVKIIFDDLETGTRLGEVQPDNSGNYALRLASGRQYAVTALTGNQFIASSYNVDLTGKTTPATRSLLPITIISTADIGEKLVLNNIFFDTGSPILLRQSYPELKRVAAFLKANPNVKVEIAGHTDAVGDHNSNLTLSQNRANSVLFYLQDQTGDTGTRLRAKGYGKAEPVAPNNTDAGRQQNRRVEFRIVR